MEYLKEILLFFRCLVLRGKKDALAKCNIPLQIIMTSSCFSYLLRNAEKTNRSIFGLKSVELTAPMQARMITVAQLTKSCHFVDQWSVIYALRCHVIMLEHSALSAFMIPIVQKAIYWEESTSVGPLDFAGFSPRRRNLI